MSNKLDKDWVVYRHFDADDQLLYVGQSQHYTQRSHEHERSSDWFREVAKITVQHFATRAEMMAAELLAIQTENPIWNKAENPNYESHQDHFLKLKSSIFPTKYGFNEPSFFEQHKELIDEVKNLRLRVKEIRKSSAWAALYIYSAIRNIGVENITCSNCIAVYNHKTIQGWALQAMRQDKARRGN